MKKIFAILMTLAMMLTCFAGLAVNSSAAELEFVEETYSYQAVVDEFPGNTAENKPIFVGGLWKYEYLDIVNKKFADMGWFQTTKPDGGVFGWGNAWTVQEISNIVTDAFTYCVVGGSGTQLHPSAHEDLDTGGVTVTFVVPASGSVSYHAGVYAYGSANTPESVAEKAGNHVYLYQNDKLIWPTADVENASWFCYNAENTPTIVEANAIEVKAGDCLRLVITTHAGHEAAKGCYIHKDHLPTITYHTAFDSKGNALPIGDPKGAAPTDIMASDRTSDGFTVKWTAAEGSEGYNVYLNGTKHNTEVITGTEYKVTGLEPSTTYTITVTSVKAGVESAPSAETSSKTRAEENKPTDTSSDVAPSTSTNTNVEPDPAEGFPTWIIIVAVAAVVVIAAVVIVLVKKKK